MMNINRKISRRKTGVPDHERATSTRLRAERLVATEIYGKPAGVTHPDQELFENYSQRK